MEQNKRVQSLQLSDNEFTTIANSDFTFLNSSDTYFSYSTLWIFIIALLSMIVILLSYCIFVFIIRSLTRKSSICRYVLPRYKSRNDFLIPATDIFLDVVHVSFGEQIRVFLTTISAPSCSLSFTGSVKVTNF